jgi:hypothetical protein
MVVFRAYSADGANVNKETKMLVYFECIDQAVSSDNIMRIYPSAIPDYAQMEEIVSQIESGVDVTELSTLSNDSDSSVIILKDGAKLTVQQTVKQIIEEMRKNG